MEFAAPFQSSLATPRERFLAHLVHHGLSTGVRSASDFIRHFTPLAIMTALADEPDLRANILEPTVGVRRKIAVRKTPASAGDDLQLALDEREADAETVLQHFTVDDRVRHLSAADLWRYATESQFWNSRASDDGPERGHVEHLLQTALNEELLTPRHIVDGLSIASLIEHLPTTLQSSVLAAVLDAGRAGRPFEDKDLLSLVSCEVLTRHVPLTDIWERVLGPKLEADMGGLGADPLASVAPVKEAGAPSIADFDDSSELFNPESMLNDLTAAAPETAPEPTAATGKKEKGPKSPRGGKSRGSSPRSGATPPPLPDRPR